MSKIAYVNKDGIVEAVGTENTLIHNIGDDYDTYMISDERADQLKIKLMNLKPGEKFYFRDTE